MSQSKSTVHKETAVIVLLPRQWFLLSRASIPGASLKTACWARSPGSPPGLGQAGDCACGTSPQAMEDAGQGQILRQLVFYTKDLQNTFILSRKKSLAYTKIHVLLVNSQFPKHIFKIVL